MTISGFTYFASAIYREELPDWVAPIRAACEPYYEEQRGEQIYPVVQTRHLAGDPALQPLANHFLQTSVEFLRDQKYLVDEYQFEVTGMWGQEIGLNGSHVTHVHGNSHMSGFYFLETPEQGCYPVFEDPRPGKRMTDLMCEIADDQVYLANSEVHFANVVPGTLLYFNSWLPHRFLPNPGPVPARFIHFILSAQPRRKPCSTI